MRRWRWPPLSWWGEAAEGFGGAEADGGERGFGEGAGFGGGTRKAETEGGEDQHAIDPVDRIIGAEGVLEDGLDFAPVVAAGGGGEALDVLAVPEDLAGGGGEEAEEEAGEGGFAAAAFADDGEDLRRRGGDGEAERAEGVGTGAAKQSAAIGDAGGAEFKRHGGSRRNGSGLRGGPGGWWHRGLRGRNAVRRGGSGGRRGSRARW